MLTPRDRFSIVVYDNEVEVLTPSSFATREAVEAAREALTSVGARGTTALAGGWLAGCGQAVAHLSEESVGRCILYTDGLANEGITEPAELAHHATELRSRGVSTSTVGIGEDYNEELLGKIADAGGGSFYHADDSASGPRSLSYITAMELGDALDIVARGVALDVTIPPGAIVATIGDTYPVEQSGAGFLIRLPDLVSGQQMEVPLMVTLPGGAIGDCADIGFRLTDRDAALDNAAGAVRFEYASDRTNDGQHRNREVDRLVASAFANDAVARASQLNRDRRFSEARDVLRKVAVRIAQYAGDDRELLLLAAEHGKRAEEYGTERGALANKMAYMTSTSMSRGRRETGEKRRRPE